MEGVLTVLGSVVVVGMLVVVVGLVVSLPLVALFAHFFPDRPTVTRASFTCPFSRRPVTAEFLSGPGAGEPNDVMSCSAFADPRAVRCGKGCLGLAGTAWMSSPMMPRFALLAGGTAYRR